MKLQEIINKDGLETKYKDIFPFSNEDKENIVDKLLVEVGQLDLTGLLEFYEGSEVSIKGDKVSIKQTFDNKVMEGLFSFSTNNEGNLVKVENITVLVDNETIISNMSIVDYLNLTVNGKVYESSENRLENEYNVSNILELKEVATQLTNSLNHLVIYSIVNLETINLRLMLNKNNIKYTNSYPMNDTVIMLDNEELFKVVTNSNLFQIRSKSFNTQFDKDELYEQIIEYYNDFVAFKGVEVKYIYNFYTIYTVMNKDYSKSSPISIIKDLVTFNEFGGEMTLMDTKFVIENDNVKIYYNESVFEYDDFSEMVVALYDFVDLI